MLFIPLFSLLAAMSLGKQEDYQLPKRTLLLYIPAAVCLALILTNDFHQIIFSFPPEEAWMDANSNYEFGYCFVIGLEIVYALTAFIIMLIKCRISKQKSTCRTFCLWYRLYMHLSVAAVSVGINDA